MSYNGIDYINMDIEKNINIPQYCNKYPLGKMEINDSFAIKTNDDNKNIIRKRVVGACHMYGKRNNKKFVTRVLKNEVRIWRVK